MPRRKTDATKDDVAAPEAAGGGEEIHPESPGGEVPPPEPLPVAGAESEPAPRTEPAETVEAVTVDEAYTEPEPKPAPFVETPRAAEQEAPDEHGEDEAGWSLPARVLTALVLLLAGVAIGLWGAPKVAPMLPSGMKPVADWLAPGASQAEADLAELRARLDQGLGGVDARLSGVPSGSDIDSRIASAVDAAQTGLAADIATLRQTVGQMDGADTRQRLDRLDTAVQGQVAELAAIKNQLAGTAATGVQLSDDAVAKIDVYRAELDGLRAEMGTLQDKVSGLATRIDEVAAQADREIASAQTRVGEIETQAATALGAAETDAAVALIRAALASGQPFADPLAQLAAQPGTTVPEGLTAAAPTGVQTLARLRDNYPDAAHAAIRASIMAGAGDGVVARSRAYLAAQVASRSLTPQTGMGPDAVLSRMEERLRQGDLQGVLAESAQLPSEAAAAMGGWLDAAKLRLDAEEGLAALGATPPATN